MKIGAPNWKFSLQTLHLEEKLQRLNQKPLGKLGKLSALREILSHSRKWGIFRTGHLRTGDARSDRRKS
ncbi:hypothetical protein TIFTF001_026677 [Ficus carica]|uniref:Uncharacterized protein n=1 Tax=Ficus carica TaxID=3494 RepID=A0AA88DLJ2_FICCA|nr:hypothetical protein TIFTF001_026677 [Ficus carica]